MVVKEYDSPLGRLYMAASGGELCLCSWKGFESHRRMLYELSAETDIMAENAVLLQSIKELDEYFAGVRSEFDVPLKLWGTEYQKRVWHLLSGIPYGATESYKGIAVRHGQPTGVRAVAGACGSNPLAIFIPCHRVVGSDGSLTGYAGGIGRKEALLKLEGIKM